VFASARPALFDLKRLLTERNLGGQGRTWDGAQDISVLLSLVRHGHSGDMRRISDIDAKNRFGQLLDAVQRQPVTVTKKGRPAAVMLSIQDYERMRGAARQRLLDTIDQMHQETAAKLS